MTVRVLYDEDQKKTRIICDNVNDLNTAMEVWTNKASK